MNKVILKKAILESVFGKYALYFFQFSTIIILARLFSPEELGYFSIVQVIIAFSILVCDSGFGPAIISDKNASRTSIESSYTITLLLGILLSIIIYLLSPYIGTIYNSEYYVRDLKWISISIIFQALCIIPSALILKKRLFLTVAKCNCVAEFVSILCLIILYQIKPSVEIIAIKFLVFSVLKFLLLYIFASNAGFGHLRLNFNLSSAKKYYKYSMYQLGFNVINFFTRNLDSLLIGKYFGFNTLGVYDRAYQLMRYPLQLVTFALVPAIQPSIVDVESKQDRIILHNWLAKNLMYIGVSISILIYVFAESIVLILFGTAWYEVVDYIRIFAIMIPAQVLMSSSGGFFQAYNGVNFLFATGVISAIFNIIAIFVGIYLGSAKFVALALLFSFNLNFFNTYFFLFKYVFQCSAIMFYKGILRPSLMFLLFIVVTILGGDMKLNYVFMSLLQLSILVLLIYLYITEDRGVK